MLKVRMVLGDGVSSGLPAETGVEHIQVGMHRVRSKAGAMVDMSREMGRLPGPDCRV